MYLLVSKFCFLEFQLLLSRAVPYLQFDIHESVTCFPISVDS